MKATVYNGLDNIAQADSLLKGPRLGLISGGSAVDRELRLAADVLSARYDLRVLFNLIHGIRWELRHGDDPGPYPDAVLGLPTYNILQDYLITLTPEMLDQIDVLVFDIREAGARYFEYLYSMASAMKLCAAAKMPFVVLDRPNPINGIQVGGNVCPETVHTMVSDYGLATRTGLTVGEFARYVNGEYNIGCDLTVIPVTGWTRRLHYDETDLPWVLPSPSMPTVEANIHYIGTCLFEGTNVSEGRGTSRPLEMIGAPWLDADELLRRMKRHDLPGVRFLRTCSLPSHSKYAGGVCQVLQPMITDRSAYDPFATALYMLEEIRDMHSDQFQWNPERQDPNYPRYVDKLLADPAFSAGEISAEDLLRQSREDLAGYRSRISQYFLYD